MTLGGCVANAGSTRSAPGAASGSPPAVSAGAASGGAAGPATTPGSAGSAMPDAGPATPTTHVRTIGPGDQGQEVVLRFGDQLSVVPTPRAGGWVVTEFPTGVLRPQGSTGAGPSHAFLAVAVGEGRLTLVPARPEARSTGVFTVRIRVLRDTVQPPHP
jgi:hypothetical protein